MMTAMLKRMTGEELLLMRVLYDQDVETDINAELVRRGSGGLSEASVRRSAWWEFAMITPPVAKAAA